MRLTTSLLSLAVLLLQPHARAQRTSTLADTVRIDALLDSAKARLSRGEHGLVIEQAPELHQLIKALRVQQDGARLQERALQASKFEGIAHYQAGDYPAALRTFQTFGTVAEQLGTPEHIGAAHNYQSYQYREMGDPQQALVSSRKAIATLRQLPPGDDLANALTGNASILSDLGHLDSGLVRLREAVSLYQRTGNSMHQGSSLLNMSDIFLSMDPPRHDSATVRLAQALPLVEASGNPYYGMMAHAQYGRSLLGMGRYDEAAAQLTIAEAAARELENDESLGRTLDLQALIAAHRNDPIKAERLLREAREAMVRDLDLAKVQEITEVRLEAEHEQERQEAAAALAAETLRRRNTLIGGGLALLIATLLGWLLFTTRRKNAQILAAQQQVVEVEKQRENEQVRTRIARDIHDEIGAGLTKIALLGNEARRRMQQQSEDLNSTLDRIVGHSREVSAALSDIVWSVDPAHDTSQELVLHARNVAQRLLEGSGVAHELRFRHLDPGHPVAPGTKHHVVMVMKEAINNALKYADAKHLTVELEAGALRVKLLVRDDGKGFDPQAMARAGNGLRNMQARAEAIGAVLSVDSTPGSGCAITLQGSMN